MHALGGLFGGGKSGFLLPGLAGNMGSYSSRGALTSCGWGWWMNAPTALTSGEITLRRVLCCLTGAPSGTEPTMLPAMGTCWGHASFPPCLTGIISQRTARTPHLSEALLLGEHGLPSRPPGPTGPRPRQIWVWTFYEGGLCKAQKRPYTVGLRLYERSRRGRSIDTESRRCLQGWGRGER